jgi:hypothetical protein
MTRSPSLFSQIGATANQVLAINAAINVLNANAPTSIASSLIMTGSTQADILNALQLNSADSQYIFNAISSALLSLQAAKQAVLDGYALPP